MEKKKQKQQVGAVRVPRARPVRSRARHKQSCARNSEGPDLHLKWSPISRGVDGPPGKASQGHLDLLTVSGS